MTHKDIYTKFMIEYDKANVTSSYPSLTEYEVATVLDKAYNALIALKITGQNVRRASFEVDLKAIEDIAPLIQQDTIFLEQSENIAPNVFSGKLNKLMLYYVDGYLSRDVSKLKGTPLDTLQKRSDPVQIINHNIAKNFFVSSYNMPWIKRPLCYMEGGEDDKNRTINVIIDPLDLNNNAPNDSYSKFTQADQKRYNSKVAEEDQIRTLSGMLSKAQLADFTKNWTHKYVEDLVLDMSTSNAWYIYWLTDDNSTAVKLHQVNGGQEIPLPTPMPIGGKDPEWFKNDVSLVFPSKYRNGTDGKIYYIEDRGIEPKLIHIIPMLVVFVKRPNTFVKTLDDNTQSYESFFDWGDGQIPDSYKFECNDTVAEELISLAIIFALENVESSRLNAKLNTRGLEG